jgi:endonuclease/exonuclease/phosphatase family metal-dependent hydrolase
VVANVNTDNLKISVTKNENIHTRTATVTIHSDGTEQAVSASVAISQSGLSPDISVEEAGSGVSVSWKSQEFPLHITANFPFYFEHAPWIREADHQAGDGVYTFTVDELPVAAGTRRDTIIVRAVNPEITETIRIPVAQADAALNVMTFNIYVASGSKLSWSQRRSTVAQIIYDEDIDILGTQETEYSQHTYLATLSEYTAYGVGRGDGVRNGEHNTILYKKSRFTEHDSGTFWLSETPDQPGSKGWDAGYVRIASWLKLEDKMSGKRIFVINTHIDHIGTQAQYHSIRLLMNKIHELSDNLPVILTGDFNIPLANDNIKYISDASANPYWLVHTKDIADVRKGHSGTYHDLNENDPGEGWFIDFIFVSENTKVFQHEVLPPKINGIFPSDHSPVTAKILLP